VKPMATIIMGARVQRVLGGHPWVFDNEVEEIRGDPAPGDVVDVITGAGRSQDRFVGRGYFNGHSKIMVRLMTRDRSQAVDDDLIGQRLKLAWEYRLALGWEPESNCFRVVHAEADLLPGLIVDRLGEVLVAQTLSCGLDRRKDFIFDELLRLTGATALVERNDVPVRELEGLPLRKGVARGRTARLVPITENGLRFMVDVLEGQKSGYFLDQKENRKAAMAYARGARVLDAFCYTGSFAVHAAAGGAESVLGLDSSPEALDLARENAALNGAAGGRCVFEAGNAFDRLRQMEKEGLRFDLIILDPPAFARSRRALEGALAGYKEINLRGLRLLRPGGTLITCSCSQHVEARMFRDVVTLAASDARRTVRLIEERSQARDHPSLLSVPEGRYLKLLILTC
jgi:23S rRNA (cytosine1962-C5)-methyltransferase